MRPHLRRVPPVALLLAAALAATARAQAAPDAPLQAVLANGYRFAYAERGAGRPVVLVHGGLADLDSWAPLLAHLGPGVRGIAYSRRYHHPNPWRPDDPPYDAASHASDLLAFIRALRVERPILVGHDAGASVALLAALRDPALFDGLVLLEPPLDSLIADPALRAASAEAERRAWAAAAAAGEPLLAARALLEARFGPGTWDRIPPADREVLRHNAPAVLLARPAEPAPACESLATLKALPVLLVEGGRTAPRFHAIVAGLRACLAGAGHVVIPEAAHAAPWTHPEAVARPLMAFLLAR